MNIRLIGRHSCYSIIGCSRMLKKSASIVQTLNAPQGVRPGASLAAALPGTRRVLARPGWAG